MLHSFGKGSLECREMDLRDPTPHEIEIETKMCGICRSDIGVYGGFEKPMPEGMFGHEGLGVVTKVGSAISDVKEGDFVATISDPAYCERYLAEPGQYVKVPEISPKYILQPTACAINILNETIRASQALNYEMIRKKRKLLVGTGFMSIIMIEVMQNMWDDNSFDIVGSSNLEIWESMGVTPTIFSLLEHDYDVIIDLSSKAENFDKITNLADIEAVIAYAATPFTPVTTNFFENCWKCHNIIMPSPRNKRFHQNMELAAELVEDSIIDPGKLWTKGYRFENAKEGFEDGLKRSNGYIRGYIEF